MPRTEAVKTYRDGREECLETAAGRREYAARTAEMARRQKNTCALCLVAFTQENPATFEHEAGRGHGGGHRDDRIVTPDGKWQNAAVHGSCNQLKGSRRFHWAGGRFIPAVFVSVRDWLAAEPKEKVRA